MTNVYIDHLDRAAVARRLKDPTSRVGHTILDFYDAVAAIHSSAEAALFFADYVAWIMTDSGKSQAEAEAVARGNIGWVFGEGLLTRDQCRMWNQTTSALHPIVATIGVESTDPNDVFQAGLAFGREMARDR